jgi:hypothetical protein
LSRKTKKILGKIHSDNYALFSKKILFFLVWKKRLVGKKYMRKEVVRERESNPTQQTIKLYC